MPSSADDDHERVAHEATTDRRVVTTAFVVIFIAGSGDLTVPPEPTIRSCSPRTEIGLTRPVRTEIRTAIDPAEVREVLARRANRRGALAAPVLTAGVLEDRCWGCEAPGGCAQVGEPVAAAREASKRLNPR